MAIVCIIPVNRGERNSIHRSAVSPAKLLGDQSVGGLAASRLPGGIRRRSSAGIHAGAGRAEHVATGQEHHGFGELSVGLGLISTGILITKRTH